jgi:hypothetical protein
MNAFRKRGERVPTVANRPREAESRERHRSFAPSPTRGGTARILARNPCAGAVLEA